MDERNVNVMQIDAFHLGINMKYSKFCIYTKEHMNLIAQMKLFFP